jgi:alkylhydroperoxidase family enzyme
MLRTIILRKLAAEERKLGESIDYVRFILRTSLGAFLRFAKIFPIAQYRKRLPVDAKHVAQIVASRDEDCGTCVQIGVNLARAEGVPLDVLRAVIAGEPERLEPRLADVYRFAEAVVTASPDADALRPRVAEHFGEEGLVELALAIASSRFFPIVKRTLGYARSCSLVTIEV